MARIEVTLSQMVSTANKIRKSSEDFLSTANQVLASANSLSGLWEGDSQVAFITEQTEANDWYKKMMVLVSSYVSNLEEAARLYQQADQESADAIKKC